MDKRVEAEALWSSPEEIRNRTFLDWLAAHTSFCRPLHHWRGVATLTAEGLELRGRHKRSHEERRISIRPGELTDVYLGFDNVFGRCEDRSLGLTFQPLRLSFRGKEGPQALYLIIGFVRWRRGSANKVWCDRLQEWRCERAMTAAT